MKKNVPKANANQEKIMPNDALKLPAESIIFMTMIKIEKKVVEAIKSGPYEETIFSTGGGRNEMKEYLGTEGKVSFSWIVGIKADALTDLAYARRFS